MTLQAPFPYFGGKRKVAPIVWERFGDVTNYVEPFFGSGAVLLGRPAAHRRKVETVNDLDGFVANFWRALKHDPDTVAAYADNPVNENDLHARHVWLVEQIDDLRPSLEADPEYYDARVAGYWVWGMSVWIGRGFCSGNGAWHNVDGRLVKIGAGGPVPRQLPHLKSNQGVKRQIPSLRGADGATGQGVARQLPHLADTSRGVNRTRIHMGNGWTNAQGVALLANKGELVEYMHLLAARLSRVRVASGDWSRVVGRSVTTNIGRTAVFLDPPYADDAGRQNDLYRKDNLQVAHEVRDWAISQGDDPMMRIALCGYEHEHEPHMPDTWEMVAWNAGMGFAGQGDGTSP